MVLCVCHLNVCGTTRDTRNNRLLAAGVVLFLQQIKYKLCISTFNSLRNNSCQLNHTKKQQKTKPVMGALTAQTQIISHGRENVTTHTFSGLDPMLALKLGKHMTGRGLILITFLE